MNNGTYRTTPTILYAQALTGVKDLTPVILPKGGLFWDRDIQIVSKETNPELDDDDFYWLMPVSYDNGRNFSQVLVAPIVTIDGVKIHQAIYPRV